MARKRDNRRDPEGPEVDDEQVVQMLLDAADQLPDSADLSEFQACLEIGRPDMAWEELRKVAEQQAMGFAFFVTMSKAADAIESKRGGWG